mgnify:FL=1
MGKAGVYPENIFSRPDVSRRKINNIVLHYVANPGSSAEGNRNYFDSLADQDSQKGGTSTSSHFIVGLEGEVIQCIPINEIATQMLPETRILFPLRSVTRTIRENTAMLHMSLS